MRHFLAVLLVLLFGCNVSKSEKPKAMYDSLKTTNNLINFKSEESITLDSAANVENEFNKAIMNKDFRFVGIYEFAKKIPGMKNDDENIRKYGVKYIKGTSDNFNNLNGFNFQIYAEKYAIQYNAKLLDYLNHKK
jgi:hypothetical protein